MDGATPPRTDRRGIAFRTITAGRLGAVSTPEPAPRPTTVDRARLPLLCDPSRTPRDAAVFVVFSKGFRPFFFGAALFAALVVPIWELVINGRATVSAYFPPFTWHAHEMIFGFATAVLAGFLLTAVENWTQRETLRGWALAALFIVWCLGRLGISFAFPVPRVIPALVDLGFLPLLMIAIGRPIVASKNRRNFVMLAILGVLFVVNVAIHLDALGLVPAGYGQRAYLVGVDTLLFVITLMAGRIFPMFTRNATGVMTIRSIPVLDLASAVGVALIAAGDLVAPGSDVVAILAGVVGVMTAVRAIHWGARHSIRHPLLWILHLGYAWIPIGLVLRGVAVFTPTIPRTACIHALTVGAVGSLCLGMMARVALGHTGRPLKVPLSMSVAFASISGAAIVRCFGAWLAPGWYLGSVVLAGLSWSVAFAIYLIAYAPIIFAARADGKPG